MNGPLFVSTYHLAVEYLYWFTSFQPLFYLLVWRFCLCVRFLFLSWTLFGPFIFSVRCLNCWFIFWFIGLKLLVVCGNFCGLFLTEWLWLYLVIMGYLSFCYLGRPFYQMVKKNKSALTAIQTTCWGEEICTNNSTQASPNQQIYYQTCKALYQCKLEICMTSPVKYPNINSPVIRYNFLNDSS